MQTCDYVQRNGRCADACRLWKVSCLEHAPIEWRQIVEESMLVIFVAACFAAVVLF